MMSEKVLRVVRRPLLILATFFVVAAIGTHLHFIEWRGDLLNFHSRPVELKGDVPFLAVETFGGPQIFALIEEPFDCKRLGCPEDSQGLTPITYTRLGIYAREFTVLPQTRDYQEQERRGLIYGIALPVVLIFAALFLYSFTRIPQPQRQSRIPLPWN